MPGNHLIAVVGPTALGKTRLAISLARHFGAEIISADSRQFYKEMAIGTAVPGPEELQAVRHHFIQHISITQPYSVGDFEREALVRLNQLFPKHPVMVLAGGSGLYIDAVTRGLDDFPRVPPEIRKGLNTRLEADGLQSLQEELGKRDPEYAATVDLQNPHRVIRALEICIGTGRPYSAYREGKRQARPFRVVTLGLEAPRELLYKRIEARVDLMMQEGLLDEARKVYEFRHLNALNTVGYKELFGYLEGRTDLETALSEIKKNTRRFAKRQLTWFRKQPDIHWVDFRMPEEEIIKSLESRIHGTE